MHHDRLYSPLLDVFDTDTTCGTMPQLAVHLQTLMRVTSMSTHLVLDADVAAEGGGGDALQLQPLCRLLRCRLINVRYHHLRALVAKARRACIADALRATCARHVAELSTRPLWVDRPCDRSGPLRSWACIAWWRTCDNGDLVGQALRHA